MIIIDEAIVLQYKRFRDNKCIIHCFLKEHGKISGLLSYNKNKFPPQPGAVVKIRWQARLIDHLGIIVVIDELKSGSVGIFLNDRVSMLMVTNCVCLIMVMMRSGMINQKVWIEASILLQLLVSKVETPATVTPGKDIDSTHCGELGEVISSSTSLRKFKMLLKFESMMMAELGIGLDDISWDDDLMNVSSTIISGEMAVVVLLNLLLSLWCKHSKTIASFDEWSFRNIKEQRDMLEMLLTSGSR